MILGWKVLHKFPIFLGGGLMEFHISNQILPNYRLNLFFSFHNFFCIVYLGGGMQTEVLDLSCKFYIFGI